MKTLTMMDFRRQPGERILDVIRDKTRFLVTKQGKPVAELGPPRIDVTVIDSDGRIHGEIPLTAHRNLGSHY